MKNCCLRDKQLLLANIKKGASIVVAVVEVLTKELSKTVEQEGATHV